MDRIEIKLIEGAYIYSLDRYHDDRGFFQEMYRQTNLFYQHQWRQSNISRSGANVVRGMHQSPYAKLVSCVKGLIYDVMVDLRPESPTFRNWYGMWLWEDTPEQILIPSGCAHGFLSERDGSMLLYFQEDAYDREKDKEWHWQSFGISWPAWANGNSCILSDKDRNAPHFSID